MLSWWREGSQRGAARRMAFGARSARASSSSSSSSVRPDSLRQLFARFDAVVAWSGVSVRAPPAEHYQTSGDLAGSLVAVSPVSCMHAANKGYTGAAARQPARRVAGRLDWWPQRGGLPRGGLRAGRAGRLATPCRRAEVQNMMHFSSIPSGPAHTFGSSHLQQKQLLFSSPPSPARESSRPVALSGGVGWRY